MSTKSAILTFSLLLLMAAGVVVGVYLVRQNQDVRSKADTSPTASTSTALNKTPLNENIPNANAQQSCTPPAQVQNVEVVYPECGDGVGAQCRFDQASCTFDEVSGATSYSVTVTEVDSGQVVKQETTTSAGKYVFPITPNRTYRCDISAVNSCGTLGPAGSAQALCAAEGAVSTPTPTVAPSAPPVATPAPTVAPTVRPQYSCGKNCNSTADCVSGLTCVKVAGGESYCAVPQFQSACVANPTLASCCKAAVLPKSGLVDETLTISLFGLIATILGLAGALYVFRKR